MALVLVSAIPTPSHFLPVQKTSRCDTQVLLDAKTNVFLNYTLHPHSAWRNMISGAVENITDPELKSQALRAAGQGTFVWM
jgi:cellulose 1,4-beta-cellobiosidase